MFGVHKGTDEYDIPRQHLNKVNLTLKNICQRDIQYWRHDYQIDWFTSTIVCQCGKSWILWVNNQTLNFYKSMWKISSHHMRVYKVSVHFCDLFFALLVLKKYYCVLKLNSPKVNFITIEKKQAPTLLLRCFNWDVSLCYVKETIWLRTEVAFSLFFENCCF